MSNLNVMPDSGNSITRIESSEISKENQVAAVNDVKDVKEKEAQKVAEESVVSAIVQQPELVDVVQEINKVMASVQRDINFSVDEKSGRKVISVYEKGSEKLIRQLPSEDALKLLENLEQLKGLLFKTDV
ncbi:MAG: flagellar protein FlaG [Colwellia sp.]|nr:flagellar protein FlaG [Colwellia sp.]NQZ80661.1 flagellar protein FlaG [Colwellia sp.]